MKTKTLQTHTHVIAFGAECKKESPCYPMGQAMHRGWIRNLGPYPIGRGGSQRRAVFVGDLELGYLSVLNSCPFCGVNFREIHDDYLEQLNEGESVAAHVEKNKDGKFERVGGYETGGEAKSP